MIRRSVFVGAVFFVGVWLALLETVSAAPLAVLAPDAPGRPSRAERIALSDAVAVTLGRALPEVLSGGETRARLEVLDPVRLNCDSTECAGQVATLLGARAVVLVLPVLHGSRLQIELLMVDPSGQRRAEERGETTIADWEDALAFARVVTERLLAILQPSSGEVSAPPSSSVVRSSGDRRGRAMMDGRVVPSRSAAPVRMIEAVLGGTLIAAGGAAVVGSVVVWARGTQCVDPDTRVCVPDPTEPVSPAGWFEQPSSLNYVWLAAGGVAMAAGTVLLIVGMVPRERASVSASMVHNVTGRFALVPTLQGSSVLLVGRF